MTNEEMRVVIDSVVASGAITMPFWVSLLDDYLQLLTLVGGIVLLCVRIFLAIREVKTRGSGEQ